MVKAIFNHQDHLGSTAVVTDKDSYLNQVLSYQPYGATRVSTQYGSLNQSNQFIGQDFDPESNLSYLNARYYNSNQGQFVSQDPVFWSNKQNLGNPQTLNSYSYAEGNPINRKDPSGLKATKSQQIKILSLQVNILQGIVGLYKSGNTKEANNVLKSYNSVFSPQNNKSKSSEKNKSSAPVQGPVQRPDITESLNKTMQSNSSNVLINWPPYFKNKVKNGGDWDLKNTSQYNSKNNSQGFVYGDRNISPDAPGNIHYGYVGSAAYWSNPEMLLNKAGEAQVSAGTSRPEWQNSNFRGDDPLDQINIVLGISQYYDR